MMQRNARKHLFSRSSCPPGRPPPA